MSRYVLKLLSLVLFFACTLALAQTPVLQPSEQDTTLEKSPKDSTRYYRPPAPEKRKSYQINMTEHMVKSNMARLSYYAQGQYMNSLQTLEEIFIQANQFPEEVKNKMFGLAIAGGVAQEVFKQTRKELYKRKIRFIYPSLYGVNITYPIRSLNAQFYFRAMSSADRLYMLHLNSGQYSFLYRDTPDVIQRGIYYKIYNNIRVFGMHTQYQYSAYHGLGVSQHTKRLFFYLLYSQSPDIAQSNRIYLYLNIRIN
ncbi:hypothetical protein EH223_17090 [candidate division KSB1 bacterium]|nr:hypothetical protein [candidate division KSB1 bacterium]RQW00866.1 MAG: hypothetical protein EH223_17090 [candidate division KSB1 bacterium]